MGSYKMGKNTKKIFEELQKQFTDEEIAESHIFPSDLPKEEQEKVDKEFSQFLKDRKMSSFVESEPSEYKPPIIENVGEEFMIWAEKGWAFEKIVSKGLDNGDGGEYCSYSLFREFMVNKINELSDLKSKQ